MQTILDSHERDRLLKELAESNQKFAKDFPGETSGKQPIHVVYGGAHLFKRDTVTKINRLALANFEQYAADAETLRKALGTEWSAPMAETIFQRLKSRLSQSCVQDYRIDFEDGYGIRSNTEEDAAAHQAASEFAESVLSGSMTDLCGIRVKPLNHEFAQRSIRTLEIFLKTAHARLQARIPEGFVITIPKVQTREQVDAAQRILSAIEEKLSIHPGFLRIELMIESPQGLFDERGHIALPAMIQAANGRCRGVHIGSYDYTASCDITAAHQHIHHPMALFALQILKNTTAGRGVWLSDGATTVIPLTVHRAHSDQTELTEIQNYENTQAIHHAWQLCFENVSRALENGIYQGWDLHPAQIPARYAAVFAFFLQSLEPARQRFKSFISNAARASTVGQVFDDAATGQGLLNYFLRGIQCGAISETELQSLGLTVNDIRTKSFTQILGKIA